MWVVVQGIVPEKCAGWCGCEDHDHHHHHADEVFDSIGIETAKKFDPEKIKAALGELQNFTEYGQILRAKGIVEGKDGKWIHFDYVPEESEVRIHEIAKMLSLEGVLQEHPFSLGKGEKQRIASARAIITNPKLILADEPTGALDSKSSKALLESFEYLNKELSSTILMVTHDAFTASYASRVIFIKDGKIFNELSKGNAARKEFFNEIIDVVTLLGGDLNDAL